MAFFHRFRRLESASVGIYELVPDDAAFKEGWNEIKEDSHNILKMVVRFSLF
jgi:hypothetical protein